MPRGRKSKLRARERRQRARAEARARGAQVTAGAEGAAAGALSASGGAPPGSPSGAAAAGRARGPAPKSKTSPWAAAAAAEGAGPDLLAQKAALLVEFLLGQAEAEAPIRRGDLLRLVHKRYRRDFPDILARARERLQLLFGLELREATPRGGAFLLVDPRGGGGGGGGTGGGGRLPRRGLLLPLLSVIFLNGNCASEEEIWAALGALGVYDGKSDLVLGEPRRRVTRGLVRERYLVHRQVPRSQPPRFEFRWGPRAQAETSKMKVLEFLARLHDTVPAAFAPHYEEALREEEERGRGPPRGPRVPKAGAAARCRYPHPE